LRLTPILFAATALLTLTARDAAAPKPLTAEDRRQLVARIADLVRDEYAFPDLGRSASEALRSQAGALTDEAAADPAAFAARVTGILQDQTRDKHMSVRTRIPHFDTPTTDQGLKKVERLPGNIGYLRVDRFYQAEESRPAFEAALDQLGACRAVVIDLRENRGGSDANVLLASYFLAERTLLNRLVWRRQDPMEFWAGPSTRPELAKVPVYVLVSRKSFSAAEGFAYGLQQRKRAVIVGEPTRGGANPNRFFPIGNDLEVSISIGRTVNPVSGTNWEGVGVQPDVAVPAEQALDKVLALTAAVIR
jgi:C-terminal processing protease CtpA/Prc